MKFIYHLLIQTWIILPMMGQSNWFLPGTKWSYEYSAFTGYGLSTLEVIPGDTMIGNHLYKKLLSTIIFVNINSEVDTFSEYLFVHEENNQVYSYDASGGEFLYNFNLVQGDTLPFMHFGGWSPSLFIVDSVGTIEINGVTLAFQDIKFEDLFNPGEFDKMRVVERIGSIHSYLFHSRLVIQPFDAPFYYFRCYEDPDIGLINLSHNHVECDYIEGITSIPNSTKLKILIRPVPSSDFITVTSEIPLIDEIYIIDLMGRIRSIIYPGQQELLNINIRELEDGLFILIGQRKSGEILFAEKIIKSRD